MNGNVIREPSRSLKEQFSRSSEAWKEQSDPIFGFGHRETGGASRSLVSAQAGISATKRRMSLLAARDRRHCRSEGTAFLRRVLAHRATSLKSDGKDIALGDDCAEP